PGPPFLQVVRLVGTVAFLGYGGPHAQESIWSGRSWCHVEASFRWRDLRGADSGNIRLAVAEIALDTLLRSSRWPKRNLSARYPPSGFRQFEAGHDKPDKTWKSRKRNEKQRARNQQAQRAQFTDQSKCKPKNNEPPWEQLHHCRRNRQACN